MIRLEPVVVSTGNSRTGQTVDSIATGQELPVGEIRGSCVFSLYSGLLRLLTISHPS